MPLMSNRWIDGKLKRSRSDSMVVGLFATSVNKFKTLSSFDPFIVVADIEADVPIVDLIYIVQQPIHLEFQMVEK